MEYIHDMIESIISNCPTISHLIRSQKFKPKVLDSGFNSLLVEDLDDMNDRSIVSAIP